MSKPYDASLKALLEIDPQSWPDFLGVRADRVEVIDADISTVTAATDKVLRVSGPAGERLQHFDFQSGPDAGVPARTHGYSTLLRQRHSLPVQTVVVLLRRAANLSAINGLYEDFLPGEAEPYIRLRYDVVRLWEVPVASLLSGGVGLLPLAPISDVQPGQLPHVIGRMSERIEREVSPIRGAELWTATKILMGLRYAVEDVDRYLFGVQNMKDSVTYQAIVAEGEQIGEVRGLLTANRQAVLALGTRIFKCLPSKSERAALEAITDVQRLRELHLKILDCSSWRELLGLPETPARRPRGKKA